MTNKVKSKAVDGAAGLNVSPDRRELHFLEKNLEELSRAHKKVPIRKEGLAKILSSEKFSHIIIPIYSI